MRTLSERIRETGNRLHRHDRHVLPAAAVRSRVNIDTGASLLKGPVNGNNIVLKRHHHCENNEVVELSVPCYTEQEAEETLKTHD
jgi:hypothetical protein